jgi:hypothetical protein
MSATYGDLKIAGGNGRRDICCPSVMAELVPAIQVVQPQRGLLLLPVPPAPRRPSIWAASKLNHVDGLDKPGHDGK